nr:ATP-dependent RNA helicase [Ipomoea batatas]
MVSGDVVHHHLIKKSLGLLLGLRLLLIFSQIFRIFCRFKEKTTVVFGLAMSVIFGFLLMALLVELYYLLWWIRKGGPQTPELKTANTSKFGFFPAAAD